MAVNTAEFDHRSNLSRCAVRLGTATVEAVSGLKTLFTAAGVNFDFDPQSFVSSYTIHCSHCSLRCRQR